MISVVFSDLHAHTYQEFSSIEGGINSRLRESLKTVERIGETASEKGAKAIFFTGDIFHLKNYIDNHAIRLTLEAFERLAEIAPIYLCAGNHDYKSWDKDPVLLEFASRRSRRIRMVEVEELEGDLKLFVFNFRRDVDDVLEKVERWADCPASVALFHQDVVGSKYGGHEVIRGLDASALSRKFGWSLVGHYHNAKRLFDNVISVGAPLQNNFGDVGAACGWWVLDTEKGLSHIENEESPCFYDLEVSLGDEIEIPGRPEIDYYRVVVAGGREVPDSLKAIRWKRISFKATSSSSTRADLKFSDTTETLMRKYIKVRNADSLDEERLLERGRRYL